MKFPSLENILIGKEYSGIEHYSLDGEDSCAYLLLKRKDNELLITYNNKKAFSDSLTKRINRKLPLSLAINTNKVLHKEVSDSKLSDEKLLHKSFPNLSIDEFYYEIWRSENKAIIAVARKKYVQEIIEKYTIQGFSIANLSLGICAISKIAGLLEEDSVNTTTQKIRFHEEQTLLSNVTILQTSSYKINGLTIQNNYLLSFSAILGFLFKTNNTTGNISTYTQSLHENFVQKSFFKKGVQIGLSTLLILLLINFFVFNHYYSKTMEMNALSELNKTTIEKVASLKKNIAVKEKAAKSIINTDGNTYASKINQITKSIPYSILLINMSLNPLEKKIKDGEKIVVEENSIVISGIVNDNSTFTKWVEYLEQIKFIKSIVIKQFEKNELLETTFTLKLTLR